MQSSIDEPPTPPEELPRTRADRRFKHYQIPAEPLEKYRPGWLHPIDVGDRLSGGILHHYLVLRKLGYGSYSTVWLAQNQITHALVVIKVTNARNHRDVETEISTYHLLESRLRHESKAAAHVIVSLLDHFEVHGPNGKHKCLVFEVMGPSCSKLARDPKLFPGLPVANGSTTVPLWMAKTIIQKMICAVQGVHFCGIVHGDLHGGNILLKTTTMDAVSAESLMQKVPPPKSFGGCELIERKDGKKDKWTPKYLLTPKPLVEFVDFSHQGLTVKLSDVGSAFPVDKPPEKVHTPDSLRPPELVMGAPASQALDVWSIGCFIYEMLTSQRLFTMWMPGGPQCEENEQELIDESMCSFADVIQAPMPETYAQKWRHRSCYYDHDGNQIRYDVTDPFCELPKPEEMKRFPKLRERFLKERRHDIEDHETERILHLLRKIFTWLPQDRPTVSQILGDSWVKSLEI